MDRCDVHVISILGNAWQTAHKSLRSVCTMALTSKAMGNGRVSADLKECALNLWDKGWDLEDIVDALLISLASHRLVCTHQNLNRCGPN